MTTETRFRANSLTSNGSSRPSTPNGSILYDLLTQKETRKTTKIMKIGSFSKNSLLHIKYRRLSHNENDVGFPMMSILFSNLLKHILLYTYFKNVIKAVLANTQGYTDCMITLQRSINFILEQPELQILEDRLKVIEVVFFHLRIWII